jgi:1-deoxy-D-xylulose-5-phosphate reductoisomerase
MRWITVLGSTGSIGLSTLDVVRQQVGRFGVYALVAGKNTDRIVQQVIEFRPQVVVVDTDLTLARLTKELEERKFPRSAWPALSFGPTARVQAVTAPEVDLVISAIVGVAGLEATYEAVRARKQIGLANKEVLVASGRLIMEAARRAGTELIPVDSEHNGAHQCLRAGERREVRRLILTASGGPFRNTPHNELASVTPAQALNHPTWKMGPRITIDSATMMNKGFEVIEACWLFGFTPDEVEVVVHPQSSVHAMVEYLDGSVVAQLSATDMRMPIQYAMTYPGRLEAPVPRMDWGQPRTLEFFPPDTGRFPLLRLAYQAQRAGGSATCTLNAADEVAVDAFLKEELSYPGIAELVEETLERVPSREAASIGEVLEIDAESRVRAREIAARKTAAGRVIVGV